jgi:hypothetical protein
LPESPEVAEQDSDHSFDEDEEQEVDISPENLIAEEYSEIRDHE